VDGFVDFFAAADPRLALLALTLHLSNIALRSLAWTNVLRAAYPDRRVPLLGIAGAYAAGMALNSFVPARGGDIAKIALVRTRIRGSSVPAIGSSMGVLSAFDALVGATVILLLAAFGRIPSPPGLPGLPAVVGSVAGHPALVGVAAALLVGAAFVVGRRWAPRMRPLWQNFRQGFAILGSPRRYATEVVPVQLAAWTCRIGAAYFLLAALNVPASLSAAAIVVMVGGLSTLVPTPGGVGTQQVMLAYLLHTTASTATIVSFSIGMQAAVTTLNVLVGLTAAMLMLRTLRPMSALRTLRQ
jgi:Lysylphosphatidylglycerol synthase TM region